MTPERKAELRVYFRNNDEGLAGISATEALDALDAAEAQAAAAERKLHQLITSAMGVKP